jgi:DNA-binding response OmpR family regulator
MPNQPHILFAEDDEDTRELLRVVLTQAGFSVSVTADPAKALQLLRGITFDAVLLDNWMPEMNGIELCRQIRLFDARIPIFFCSGAASEADKADAVSAGAQGYFTKPFDPEALVSTLRSTLRIAQP